MIIKRRLRLCFLMALVLFVVGTMIAGEAFAVSWFNYNWLYRKMITVQAGQVIGGPHADFPMLVSVSSDADLAAKAQSDGGDIVFTNSSGIRLPHETVNYSSGTLLAWVNVDSINNGTVIYMYYGNSTGGLTYGISEIEKEAVWNSNFMGVWHFDESSGAHYDSTSHDNDGTASVTTQGGTSFTLDFGAASSKIGGADQFEGGTGNNVTIPDNADGSLDTGPSKSVTIEAWILPDTGALGGILKKGTGAFFGSNYFMIIDEGNCAANVIAYKNFDAVNCDPSTPAITLDTWQHIAYVYELGTTTSTFYVNGVSASTNSTAANALNTASNLVLGSGWGAFDGLMDEVRISDTNRLADWIKTSFNNQNAPSSFLSFSEQVSIPTMTEWGMIIFMVLAGLGSVYYLRKRRIAH